MQVAVQEFADLKELSSQPEVVEKEGADLDDLGETLDDVLFPRGASTSPAPEDDVSTINHPPPPSQYPPRKAGNRRKY